MFGYDVEKKKVEECTQQIYRDFATKYSEIKNSDISEEEKQAKISEIYKNTSDLKQILRNTRSLSEIAVEDREALGISEESEPTKVDKNVINTLVSIYAKRAKIPNEKNRNIGIMKALTLRKNESLEEIDTTEFEEELRKYFTEHYYDLLSTGYNDFLSEITQTPDDIRILNDKYGDLTQIAMKYNIEPEKFRCFGYGLTVQDGLVAEEDSTLGRSNIFYATPEGINKRIFDLYSVGLYRDQNEDSRYFANDTRKLKNTYISYAEKNGIEITNPDVLETLDIDMDKVQKLAKYINRVVNDRDSVENGEYTKLFQDDIIKNYSKIMNLQSYDFGDLESVKSIAGENNYIDKLYLRIEEDNISRHDEFRPDIAYGTPDFIRKEYQSIMQQVEALHQTNAFQENSFDVEKITAKKHAYRRYIQENGIEGIDISIPDVEVDHDRTKMIADAIFKQYGKEYKDADTMKSRILAKLEDNWAEIVTEAQVMDVKELFGEELNEMGYPFPDEQLYVKDDFIYIGDFLGANANVIYATKSALKENLAYIDKKIASNDLNFEEKNIRESLVKYANEQGFNIDIPSVESIESRGKQERELLFGGFGRFTIDYMPDDPTAREKIDLNDSFLNLIVKMSEGNPGAIVGLTNLLKADKTGGMLLLGLDDMNIRGSQVWVAYKDLYHENAEKFAQAVHNRDRKMVDFINQEQASVGEEKAVTGGASFDRSKTPDKYRFTEEEVEELRQQKEERLEKERKAREKMLANSPAKKNRGAKKRAEREEKRQAYRQRLIALGKKSIGELDEELTELQSKEEQAKELCEKFEEQLPDKSHQEL